MPRQPIYFLAKTIPDIDKHIHIVVAAVIFLSLLPGIISIAVQKCNSVISG